MAELGLGSEVSASHSRALTLHGFGVMRRVVAKRAAVRRAAAPGAVVLRVRRSTSRRR